MLVTVGFSIPFFPVPGKIQDFLLIRSGIKLVQNHCWVHDKPKNNLKMLKTKKQAFLSFKNLTEELISLKEFSFSEQNSPLEHNLAQETLVISK